MYKLIQLSLFISIIFSSCSTSKKIAALKPEPDDAESLVYDHTSSFISLPVTIKLKDVENQQNLEWINL